LADKVPLAHKVPQELVRDLVQQLSAGKQVPVHRED
jgi:hypothetical protein